MRRSINEWNESCQSGCEGKTGQDCGEGNYFWRATSSRHSRGPAKIIRPGAKYDWKRGGIGNVQSANHFADGFGVLLRRFSNLSFIGGAALG